MSDPARSTEAATCQECHCCTGGGAYCYEHAPYRVWPKADGTFIVDRNGRKRVSFTEPPASPDAEAPTADYRQYAIRQLQIAGEKAADAPASAQMHEEQAAYALRIGRVPRPGETLLRDQEDVIAQTSAVHRAGYELGKKVGAEALVTALAVLVTQWREKVLAVHAQDDWPYLRGEARAFQDCADQLAALLVDPEVKP